MTTQTWKEVNRYICVDTLTNIVIDYITPDDGKLHKYCMTGYYEICQQISTAYDDGLYAACEFGHIEIVKLMIEKGASDWESGLFMACEGGHMEIVKLMIEKGANDWDDGLSAACDGGHTDIANLMIENGATHCSYCDDSEHFQ
jgi:hypothetical protein